MESAGERGDWLPRGFGDYELVTKLTHAAQAGVGHIAHYTTAPRRSRAASLPWRRTASRRVARG